MRVKFKTIIPLIAASFLISCSHIPTKALLKLPPSITYPIVLPEEVSCLNDNTFNKIKLRDRLKSARIETLTNIIKSTH